MRTFRIGTRSSALALIQTREVVSALEFCHPSLRGKFEVVPMKTTGDTIVDRSLIDFGGKSLFTKEIEDSLLKGKIDLAAHSMKDMAVEAPPGLIIPAMLEREDPRDALITQGERPLEAFSPGSRFGTSSLRRQAHVLHKYPQFKVIPLRGNVPTRLQKIENGEVEITLLAVAGLKRLGILEKATQILSLEEFLPAVGQGAIGIQCRADDQDVLELLKPINHYPTFQAVTAERAFMKRLQGSCRTPIAAYAYLKDEILLLKGMLSTPEGVNMHFISHKGLAPQAEALGTEAAELLQKKICTASS